MKRRRFRTELLTGHKGPAVFVPFDPAEEWGSEPVRVASRAYGIRPGHLVRGTLNGRAFDGWIGHRWGNFFILVDPDLQRAAGAEVGELVEVTVAPRAPKREKGQAKGKAAATARKPPRRRRPRSGGTARRSRPS